MRFARFYGIPVARPWAGDSEHRAFENALELYGAVGLPGEHVLPAFAS
jgi:hypothetical protein